jgi:hypothetical protein
MALYTGVLRKMADGVAVSNLNRSGWVRREFVQIGNTHLRNVRLRAYHDALLRDSLGQTVTLSTAGRGLRSRGATQKLVVAIRTPGHGITRPNPVGLLFLVFFAVMIGLMVAVFVAVAALVGWFILASFVGDSFFWPYVAVSAVCAGLLLVEVLVLAVRMFYAWGAISFASRRDDRDIAWSGR